ncbi:MAG: flagellar FliJ family protein [Verrucomicrobiae bacterium]|nr:flagellar FliJ family protein [Verrucomicrobiae bacterium]
MKPFRFTLQAVLTVRQRQEREALERYAAALMARRKAGEALESAEEELVRGADVLRTRLAAAVPAGDAARHQDHLRELDVRRAQAVEVLRTADRGVASALQAMLEARRQREVVEQCRDKQRQRHQRDQWAAEAKLIDELALRRTALARTLHGTDPRP